MDEVTGAYELGRRKDEKEFSFVRVYEVGRSPFEGPYEEFRLGEPVHLKTIRLRRAGSSLVSPDDKVWWIQEFMETGGEGKAGVSESRNKPGSLLVPVMQLEKLPGMVRLAVEYAF
jgi:hypothetical protein